VAGTDSGITREFVVRGDSPTEEEMRRIEQRLEGLEKRLVHRPDPRLHLVLEQHPQQRRSTVELSVSVARHGRTLVSHQAAETAELAVKLAVDDVARQLERVQATQEGQPSWGVPSRRPFNPPRAGQEPGSE
jgi:ribosome-associated translation inhibitor RaiA